MWRLSFPPTIFQRHRPCYQQSAGKHEDIPFVAPNTEFNNTLWLVRHCKLYFQDNITEEGTFEFTQIPIGTYVAMVPAWSFRRGQGFPVINEFEEQGYQADIAWHGGDSQYSLVAFMIEPIPEGSAVRHYE